MQQFVRQHIDRILIALGLSLLIVLSLRTLHNLQTISATEAPQELRLDGGALTALYTLNAGMNKPALLNRRGDALVEFSGWDSFVNVDGVSADLWSHAFNIELDRGRNRAFLTWSSVPLRQDDPGQEGHHRRYQIEQVVTLLGPRARSAIGLDLSRQMLNLARSRVAEAGLGACELRHGDILDVDLPDGEADLVVAHQVLHYLGEPAAAVAEAARLVAPGGKLLVVDFAPHDLEFLRDEHRHRRLGFFDNEIERWAASGGLAKVTAVALPPAGPGGLTVKVWTAERERQRVRRIA
jgi:hypothetical protein